MLKSGLEILFVRHDQPDEVPKINSLEEAFAAAYQYLSDRKVDPHSEEGQKFLAQVTSSAGQYFDGYPPLPGTKSNAQLLAEIEARS